MKKLFYPILVIAIVISLSLVATAQSPLLSDNADLLSDDEEITLSALLEAMSDHAKTDIAVMTIDFYHGSDIESYTEAFCDDGFMEDGILLVVSMSTREYCLTKCGTVQNMIDDAGLDYIEEAFIPYLTDGEYLTAFSVFASLSRDAIDAYNDSGEIYDGEDFAPQIHVSSDGSVTISEGSRPLSHYVICVAIGLVLALVAMLIMQSGMKTVKSRNYAGDYVIDGSLALRTSSDRFLYRTVSKTPKPQSNGSSGRGFSGGSGRSSSGRF